MHFTCETTQPGWGLSQRSQKWDLRSTCTVKHELCNFRPTSFPRQPCCDVLNDALNELHPLLWELLWVVVFQAGSTFRSLASLFVLIGGWRREATEKINGQGRYIPKQYIICVWYSQPDVVTSTQMVLSKHQEHNTTSLQSGYQGLCNAAWGRNRQWLLSFWNLAMEFICDWSIHCTLV